ncbi:MAG: hypothetical protein IIT39_01445 [Clostridia bacterium]|nr:hypothetical protein [Clostridia bacterium]
MKKICVIGGMNFSMLSKLDGNLEQDNSLLGEISTRFGGVAWNIASALAKYPQHEINFITVLSSDVIGCEAVKLLTNSKVRYKDSVFTETWHSFYCDIHSNQFHYGINDMRIFSLLSPEWIMQKKNVIEQNDILIIDANLDIQTIEYITKNIKIPIYCDATSIEKCQRIKSVFSDIAVIKFNKKEFCTFFEVSESALYSDEKVECILRKSNANTVIITIEKDGSMIFKNKKLTRFQTKNIINAVNTLQAGDIFFATCVTKLLTGEDDISVLVAASSSAEKRIMKNNSHKLEIK